MSLARTAAILLLVTQPPEREAQGSAGDRRPERPGYADKCYSKGGIGIIRQDLYVVVKSRNNEVRLKDRRWVGREARSPELVIVFENEVWPVDALPAHFDLSKAVIVSFETSKIKVFDFSKMEGCDYSRIPER